MPEATFRVAMARGLLGPGPVGRPFWGSEAARHGGDPGAGSLAGGLLLVTLVWSVLLAGGLALAPRLGDEAATCVAFLAALSLVVAARERPQAGPLGRVSVLVALGLAAGFASYPAWVLAIAGAGTALGLAPGAPLAAGAGTPLVWISTLALAPIFEELLYRERLLPALRRALGTLPALVLSSALFALPHRDPWSVLATFLVGLALGGLLLLSGSVAPCIGAHAGLNLGALACGIPPVRLAPPAGVGGLVALALVAAVARHNQKTIKKASSRWTRFGDRTCFRFDPRRGAPHGESRPVPHARDAGDGRA